MKLSYQFPKRTILVDSLNYLTMNKVPLSSAIYQCLTTSGVLILWGVAPMKTLLKQHGRTLWTFAVVEFVSFILQFSSTNTYSLLAKKQMKSTKCRWMKSKPNGYHRMMLWLIPSRELTYPTFKYALSGGYVNFPEGRRFEDIHCLFSMMLVILDGRNDSGCLLFLPQSWKWKMAAFET